MIPVGSNATHTVCAAELVGIDTALNQIVTGLSYQTDVNPICDPYRQSGHYSYTDPTGPRGHPGSIPLGRSLKRLMSLSFLQWILGAESNERADDDAAKETARTRLADC